jgi:hypothetical protein
VVKVDSKNKHTRTSRSLSRYNACGFGSQYPAWDVHGPLVNTNIKISNKQTENEVYYRTRLRASEVTELECKFSVFIFFVALQLPALCWALKITQFSSVRFPRPRSSSLVSCTSFVLNFKKKNVCKGDEHHIASCQMFSTKWTDFRESQHTNNFTGCGGRFEYLRVVGGDENGTQCLDV